MLESFEDYVSVETLDGENKYDAGDHGLQVGIPRPHLTVATPLSVCTLLIALVSRLTQFLNVACRERGENLVGFITCVR